jgi:hypothetical protein
MRYGQGQELSKRHPGFTAEDAALGVKLNKTVKATGQHQGTVLGQANIAITAAISVGKQWTG